jgi:hypothetical protein
MLMLLHRAGVTIGDGCVVGAGSVVTKSMLAYHVIIGNPARSYSKVTPDFPDAPGLIYEVKVDCVFVVGNKSLEDGHRVPDQEKRDFGLQSLGWDGLCRAKASVLPGERRPTAIQVCELVAAAALGYWLKSLM